MPDSFDTPTDAIFHLAYELKELEQRAIVVYEPVVNAIVSSRSTVVRQIVTGRLKPATNGRLKTSHFESQSD